MQAGVIGGAKASERRHLILAGGGHTHALVLRLWASGMIPRPAATHISLVNRRSTALYSGMVPGQVAGLYTRQACAIDLRRLCRHADVTFLQGEISGIDPCRRELRLAGRPPLRYDRLSLDVGAVTAVVGEAMAVKPLEPFLSWFDRILAQGQRAAAVRRPLTIRGGGAAAVELALAFRARGLPCRVLLRGERLHLGSRAAERAGERLLQEAGVALERGTPAGQPADLACTGSRAPHWLKACGLPVEPHSGRVLTAASLAVEGHPELFAVGDCGVIGTDPRPPAGVWAVRCAPVLARNLGRSLQDPGASLEPWRPQRRALQLLGDGGAVTGRPRALAFWGPLALGPAGWLWRWKDRIDRRFMDSFAEVTAAMGRADRAAAAEGGMACRGCAAKLAAAPLQAALARLEPAAPPPPAQDAAVIGTSAEGFPLLQSVDGFPALLGDPWRNARLTTLHACGDLWACGAVVRSVQALVTLPRASAALQEDWLLQTLAGIRAVLDPLGARLLGGHTMEGRDGAGLALSLSVNGVAPAAGPWEKGPLRRGDVLLLSRPLGSGVIFAAAMADRAEPRWIDAALALMEQSQAPLVDLLAAHGCRACTDVTGFGLLGHLGEMLRGAPGAGLPAPRLELDATAIPAMEGALELLEAGLASTLAPANATALGLLEGPVRLRLRREGEQGCGSGAARRGLLLDPQTCGPLLAALPPDAAAGALAALRAAGFDRAAVIGRVLGPPPTTPPLRA